MGRGRESRTERSPGRWEHFVTACCPRGGRWELRATVKQNTTPDGRDSSSLLRSGTSLAAVPDAVPVRVVSYRAVPCRTVVPPSPYSSSPPPPPPPQPSLPGACNTRPVSAQIGAARAAAVQQGGGGSVDKTQALCGGAVASAAALTLPSSWPCSPSVTGAVMSNVFLLLGPVSPRQGQCRAR